MIIDLTERRLLEVAELLLSSYETVRIETSFQAYHKAGIKRVSSDYLFIDGKAPDSKILELAPETLKLITTVVNRLSWKYRVVLVSKFMLVEDETTVRAVLGVDRAEYRELYRLSLHEFVNVGKQELLAFNKTSAMLLKEIMTEGGDNI